MINWWDYSQLGVIDYRMLMNILSGYKAPHRKITILLEKKELIRIKKGIYLVGEMHRKESISKELIANLIYGPSYISQEYALQHYGLIPEQVKIVTNMTTSRKKYFETSLGIFQYSYINLQRFTVGIDILNIRKNIQILIASPEKALVDVIALVTSIQTITQMRQHLIENLRIDASYLNEFNKPRLFKITQTYKNKSIDLLYKTTNRGV